MTECTYPRLSARQQRRILSIATALEEVYFQTRHEWLDGFDKDWCAEREISIWEVIALAYSSFETGQSLTSEAKREAFSVISSRVLGHSDDEILGKPRTFLDAGQCEQILAHFDAAARALNMLDTFA